MEVCGSGEVWWEGRRCVRGVEVWESVEMCGRDGGVWWERWRCVEGVEDYGVRGKVCGGRGGGMWWRGRGVLE